MTTSAVAKTLSDLFDRQIIFVGGKGGVGKTTTAAALALAASEGNRRCLLVSTDPAHSLGDIFDQPIGDNETTLADNLTGLEIDPDDEAASHIDAVKDQMKLMVHPRMYGEIDRQLELARYTPGATEAALLERVADLMAVAGNRFDLVIFDTAPSGHTLRLLSLPEIMTAWIDGLLRHRARSNHLSSMLKALGGGRKKGDDLSLLDSAEEHDPDSLEGRVNTILSTRRRKFILAREQLVDAAMTAFVIVVNPDRLSILESQRVVATLRRFELSIAALVVNRVLTDNIPASGVFIDSRRAQETAYLDEIDETFPCFPRIVIPLKARDVHGLDALQDIAAELVFK